jgi:hypothetical protein
MNRRRPTISLAVMLVLGLLWCGFWALFQGERSWQPSDKGWFAGWIAYYVLTAAVLVLLWWKRARDWVIVMTPIASTVITIALLLPGWVPTPSMTDAAADEFTATFIDGFWRMFLWAVIAAAIAAAIGLVAFRSQGGSQVADGREIFGDP